MTEAERQRRIHAEFAKRRRDYEELIAAIVAAYLAGGDTSLFERDMREALLNAHTEACYLGRTLAGDTAPPEEDDRKFAALVMAGELWFLARFVEDLERGRYVGEDGEIREAGIRQRALLYAGKLAATAIEAWALTLGPEAEGRWVLQPAEHCETCLSEAALGWRPLQSFTRWPGGGDTICLTNCKCFVETRSGAQSVANAASAP